MNCMRWFPEPVDNKTRSKHITQYLKKNCSQSFSLKIRHKKPATFSMNVKTKDRNLFLADSWVDFQIFPIFSKEYAFKNL